jgi:EmrB/QacA subfamily drug resistance transporter
MLAQFMAAVESTIVGTALPTIVGDLGGFQLFSWIFAAYLLTQAISTPVYGRLADIYGRKRVFFAGASLFLVSSLACGFAWGMGPLILFRALQGLGAGAIQPIAWTIIGDIYSPADRARMQGWLSSVFAGSAILGPALGGFIVEHLTWALVFWINIPVGIAAILMLQLVLRETPVMARRQIDYAGAAMLMLGVGALLIAVEQGRTLSEEVTIPLAVFGAATLIAMAWYELNVAEPIVPFRLWRQGLIAIGNFGAFMIGVMMMCNGGYLPAYVQGAMGGSPTTAGFVLGSSSITWTVGTILAARLMVRTSYRTACLVGAVMQLAATVFLLFLEPARGPIFAAVGASALGLGMGYCNTTFIVSVQTAVGWGERGAVTAANLFMRTIGQALGAALFGLVLAAGIARRVPDAGDAVNQLLQPGLRASLAPGIASRLTDAFGAAMHEAYYLVIVLGLVILGLAVAIPARLSPTRLPAQAAADD